VYVERYSFSLENNKKKKKKKMKPFRPSHHVPSGLEWNRQKKKKKL
jgi:hypothetical protein